MHSPHQLIAGDGPRSVIFSVSTDNSILRLIVGVAFVGSRASRLPDSANWFQLALCLSEAQESVVGRTIPIRDNPQMQLIAAAYTRQRREPPAMLARRPSVIYEQGIGNVQRTLWKVPIEGGEPAPITEFHALRPAISPDGKNIAFYFMDKARANSPWCVGIVSTNGGEMTAKFDLPATAISRFVNWTADSKNLAYINDIGGVSNIWLQPIAGEPPSQITNFQSGRILAFDWWRDGKQFVFSQATESSYVALAAGLLD